MPTERILHYGNEEVKPPKNLAEFIPCIKMQVKQKIMLYNTRTREGNRNILFATGSYPMERIYRPHPTITGENIPWLVVMNTLVGGPEQRLLSFPDIEINYPELCPGLVLPDGIAAALLVGPSDEEEKPVHFAAIKSHINHEGSAGQRWQTIYGPHPGQPPNNTLRVEAYSSDPGCKVVLAGHSGVLCVHLADKGLSFLTGHGAVKWPLSNWRGINNPGLIFVSDKFQTKVPAEATAALTAEAAPFFFHLHERAKPNRAAIEAQLAELP